MTEIRLGAPHRSSDAGLTAGRLGLLLLATAAIFLVAYGVAGWFGRIADDNHGAAAQVVPAERPTGEADILVMTRNIAFDTDRLEVTANQPVVIRVDNEDAGIMHNIAVYMDSSISQLVARGELFDGVHVRQYRFEGFEAGSYYFHCDLHPQMKGTLVAQ